MADVMNSRRDATSDRGGSGRKENSHRQDCGKCQQGFHFRPLSDRIRYSQIFCLGPAACYTRKATLRENSDFSAAEPHVRAAPHTSDGLDPVLRHSGPSFGGKMRDVKEPSTERAAQSNAL
jgi:hypothetical protein